MKLGQNCERQGSRLERFSFYSANQQKGAMPLMTSFKWRMNVNARRLSLAAALFPGFTSYSARNCRKKFFGVAKGSQFGPSNDPESARIRRT